MIKESTKVLSSLSKHNSNLHPVQSPRELVTGIKLVVPKIQMGQYSQGSTGGSKKSDSERYIDCLYIGPRDNGSEHWVLNLATKQKYSVN